MKRFLPIVFLLGAIAASGCSSGPLVTDAPVRDLPSGFPDHTADQIHDSLQASIEGIHSFSTDGSIEITSRDESNSGGLSLRSRVADSLSAVVRGPLGIVAGRALITGDSMFFADRINGMEYGGSLDDDAPIPPPFSHLGPDLATNKLWLLGFLASDESEAWDIQTDSLHYVMTRSLPTDETERIVVDPALWTIKSYVLREAGHGHLIKEVSFTDFDVVDGRILPRRATVQFPTEETTVQITHDRLVINPTDLRIATL